MHAVSSDALGPKYPGGRARSYGYVFNIRRLTATFRKDGVTEDKPSECGTFASLLDGFCGASAWRRSYDSLQT
jgi:hypothetical protein